MPGLGRGGGEGERGHLPEIHLSVMWLPPPSSLPACQGQRCCLPPFSAAAPLLMHYVAATKPSNLQKRNQEKMVPPIFLKASFFFKQIYLKIVLCSVSLLVQILWILVEESIHQQSNFQKNQVQLKQYLKRSQICSTRQVHLDLPGQMIFVSYIRISILIIISHPRYCAMPDL